MVEHQDGKDTVVGPTVLGTGGALTRKGQTTLTVTRGGRTTQKGGVVKRREWKC